MHVLTLAGRVGHASGPVLAETLTRLLEIGNPCLVVDFTGVDYISSAGLEVLERAAATAAAAGGALIVTGVSDPVRMAFDLAGILSTLPSEPSRAQAIARARDAGSRPADHDAH